MPDTLTDEQLTWQLQEARELLRTARDEVQHLTLQVDELRGDAQADRQYARELRDAVTHLENRAVHYRTVLEHIRDMTVKYATRQQIIDEVDKALR